MDILTQINQNQQALVNQELAEMTEAQLVCGPTDRRRPKDFLGALRAPGIQVIAEVKKASPSKGVIRPDFDPVWIAQSYQKAGAACLSVLTEEKHFQGSKEIFKKIRQAVDLPLLRKDFVVDRRQIRETYDLGADALLLIVASLSDAQLAEFYQLARGFGLTVLVEVHQASELERALKIHPELIGVNNRNLKTFQTDLETSVSLKTRIPTEVVVVSESGIGTFEQVSRMEKSGFEAILVGESLMRQPDPGQALLKLTRGQR